MHAAAYLLRAAAGGLQAARHLLGLKPPRKSAGRQLQGITMGRERERGYYPLLYSIFKALRSRGSGV